MAEQNNEPITPTEELWHCGHEAEEPHPCPYKMDIYGDDFTLCTCCEGCQYQCAQDV